MSRQRPQFVVARPPWRRGAIAWRCVLGCLVMVGGVSCAGPHGPLDASLRSPVETASGAFTGSLAPTAQATAPLSPSAALPPKAAPLPDPFQDNPEAPIPAPDRLSPHEVEGSPDRWKLADVRQQVLANHPLLRMRQHEVTAAQARVVTVGLLPNPQLTLDSDNATDGSGKSELSGRLMMILPWRCKRGLRTAAAQAAVAQAELAMDREATRILGEAEDSFNEVLYLQELVAETRRLAELAQHNAKAQRQRFDAAAVSHRSVVLAELSAHRLEIASREAGNRLNQAKLRLARAVGNSDGRLPSAEGLVAVERVVLPELAEVLARAAQTSPELAQSAAAIEESEHRYALETWNALPDPSLGLRARESFGASSGDQVGGRLAVDLPLFDRNQGRIAESDAQIGVAAARHQALEVAALGDVAALYLALQEVQSRADYYARAVRPLVQETETALREAFSDRAVNAQEVSEMLESLARMRLSDLEIRREHQRLRWRLELLLDRTLASEPLPNHSPAGGGGLPFESPKNVTSNNSPGRESN